MLENQKQVKETSILQLPSTLTSRAYHLKQNTLADMVSVDIPPPFYMLIHEP